MNDRDLAQALYQSGLLTQEQIQSAAESRSEAQSFTDVIVRNGWVTPEQIAQVTGQTSATSAWDTSTQAQTFAPPPFNATPMNHMAPPPLSATPASAPPPIPAPSGGPGAFGQSAPRPAYHESANGVLILVLGIVGLFVIQLLAPVAWFMGNNSLRAINSGRADPGERGLVVAGRIMGIIGSIIMIVTIGFLILIAVLTVSGRRISNTFNPATSTIPVPSSVR